jgi:hypothetical protein
MKSVHVLTSYFGYSTDILAASKSLSCPQFRFIFQQGDINPTLQDLLRFGRAYLRDGFMRLCTIGFTAVLAKVYQARLSNHESLHVDNRKNIKSIPQLNLTCVRLATRVILRNIAFCLSHQQSNLTRNFVKVIPSMRLVALRV